MDGLQPLSLATRSEPIPFDKENPRAYYDALRERVDAMQAIRVGCETCRDFKTVMRSGKLVDCPECVPVPSLVERVRRMGAELKTFAEWRDEPEMREAKQACLDLLAGERWCVLLRGYYGKGKTHLAIATLAEHVERGGVGLFRNVPDLLDDLRNTYSRTKQDDDAAALSADASLTGILKGLELVELLILDDLGAQKTTEWASEKLYQIIDRRYRRKAMTFVTTNVKPSEEQAHGRLLDRLKPGEVVIVGQGSRRGEYDR